MLNNIKSFGLNVIPDRRKTIEHTAQVVEKSIIDMWQPALDYLEEYDNVFSGKVENEIDKLNAHAMNLGMAMNSASPKRSLNIEW